MVILIGHFDVCRVDEQTCEFFQNWQNLITAVDTTKEDQYLNSFRSHSQYEEHFNAYRSLVDPNDSGFKKINALPQKSIYNLITCRNFGILITKSVLGKSLSEQEAAYLAVRTFNSTISLFFFQRISNALIQYRTVDDTSAGLHNEVRCNIVQHSAVQHTTTVQSSAELAGQYNRMQCSICVMLQTKHSMLNFINVMRSTTQSSVLHAHICNSALYILLRCLAHCT